MAKIVLIFHPIDAVPPDPEDLAIETVSLASGTSGVQYSVLLSATSGTTPYTWSKLSGSLPTGITLSAAGLLAGTPSVTGVFTFTIRVTDSAGSPDTDDQAYVLTIDAAPVGVAVVNTVLTPGIVGTAYTATLTATSGTGPYTFQHVSGKPTWMTLPSSGSITGTPDAAAVSSIIVTATDALAAVSPQKTLSLTVTAALSMVTTSPLASGTAGVAYSVTLSATGGTTPYTWAITAGALPAPLTLDPTSGLISGTPNESGVFAFTARVTDNAASPAQASGAFDMTIAAAPSVLTVVQTNIPGGTVSTVYPPKQMQAVGGTSPYTWDISAGALPTGLAISSFGIISGTPSAAGTFTFTVRVTDSVAATALSGSFTVVIVPASVLTVTTSIIPSGEVGTAYTATLTAANGTAPYTWTHLSGKPSWMTINANGTITGTPDVEASTSTTISVRVTDNVAATDDHDVSLPRVYAAGQLEGPHDYYTTWSVVPEVLRAYDLRSQAGLDARMKVSPSLYWTYNYAGDTHALKQDAAKLVKPPRRLNTTAPYTAIGAYLVSKGLSATIGSEGIHTDKQIIVPIGISTGTILITYDIWFGQEYFDNNGTVNAEKAIFTTLATASAPTGEPKNFDVVHIRLRPQQINGALNEVGRLHDDSDDPGGVPFWAGLTSRDPYVPTINADYPSGAFRVHANKWTRFWDLIELNVAVGDFTEWNTFTSTTLAAIATTTTQGGLPIGTNIPFDRRTRWMADEDREAVRVFGPAPFPHHPAYPYIGRTIFRWDTSTENWTEFNETQVIDLNDIGAGDTFTLTVPAIASSGLQNPNSTFPAETTAPISESADMSTAIDTALEALNVIYHVAVVKGAGQTYSITYTGLGTHTTAQINMPLLVVNPTGFTPNAVTTTQPGGRQADLAKGQTGALVGYHRNITVHHNLTVGTPVSNPALFKRPVS
jgi:hypothetical protein